MQCKSQENGLIVHNRTEKKNEKLSIHNITSRLRLNLPDLTSIPSSHPIVELCRVRHMPSNSQLSEAGIYLSSMELFSLSGPPLNKFIMFDLSLVLSSLSLAHYESKFIWNSFILCPCPAKFLRWPAANIDFFPRVDPIGISLNKSMNNSWILKI